MPSTPLTFLFFISFCLSVCLSLSLSLPLPLFLFLPTHDRRVVWYFIRFVVRPSPKRCILVNFSASKVIHHRPSKSRVLFRITFVAGSRDGSFVSFLAHDSPVNRTTHLFHVIRSSNYLLSSTWQNFRIETIDPVRGSPSRPEVDKRRIRNRARHWTARTSSARGEPLADSRAHVWNSCACTDAFSLPISPLSFPFLSFPFLSNSYSCSLQPSPLSSIHN